MNRMRVVSFTAGLATVMALAAAPSALAGEPGLDPSFGSGGRVVSDFGHSEAAGRAVAAAPDGSYFTVGSNCTLPPVAGRKCDLALVRYGNDGSEQQRTPTGFAGAEDLLANDMAIDSLGRIVVVGRYYSQGWSPGLIRYLSDGSIDPTLSAASLPPSFSVKEISALAIDAADRILVAGPSSDGTETLLGRLGAAGSLDTAFGGGDGIAAIAGRHVVSEVVLAADGAIFVGGGTEAGDPEAGDQGAPLLWGFDASGEPLHGFSPPTSLGAKLHSITDIALDSQGRLLAGLTGNAAMVVARIRRDGSLDPGFGAAGLASMPSCSRCDSEPVAVAVDAADRVLVVGGRFHLARYTAAGQVDPSFARGGVMTVGFDRGRAVSADLIVDSTGRALVGGSRFTATGTRLALATGTRQFALARIIDDAPRTTLTCRGQRATIVGSAGDEELYGTVRRDVIVAGAGEDHIYGGSSADLICAGAGEDFIGGGAGGDRIFTSAGEDRIYGGAADDLIKGGPGADRIDGNVDDDRIYGQGGADRIFGSKGADLLLGGSGGDKLAGGDDADRIFGQAGNDRLFGQKGNDLLDGGLGADLLQGGPGTDRLRQGERHRAR